MFWLEILPYLLIAAGTGGIGLALMSENPEPNAGIIEEWRNQNDPASVTADPVPPSRRRSSELRPLIGEDWPSGG